MKKSIFTLGMFILSSSIIISCNKNKDETIYLEENGDFITENLAARSYEEVADISDQAITNDDIIIYGRVNESTDNSIDFMNKSACASVTRTVSANAVNIVVDYGPVNCGCPDGKQRKGIIKIRQAIPFAKDSTRVITFDNYFVNNNKLGGLITITKKENTTEGFPVVGISITNGSVVLAANGGTLLYASERTRTHTEGASTPLIFNDDVFKIEGTRNGTTPAGILFTSTITNPLIHKRKLDCRETVQGTIRFTKTGKPDKVIDFGNGLCDNTATVTVGNLAPRTIILN